MWEEFECFPKSLITECYARPTIVRYVQEMDLFLSYKSSNMPALNGIVHENIHNCIREILTRVFTMYIFIARVHVSVCRTT